MGLLVSVAPAAAADFPARLPVKAPAVAPVAFFNWTGCYIGGQAGGGWGRKTFTDDPASPFPVFIASDVPLGSVADNISGFAGGGQIGCDYQFTGNWVLGVQGLGLAADVSGDALDTLGSSFMTLHAKTEWIATSTARLGYAWDRVLLYAKGGVAFDHDRYSANTLALAFGPVNETRTGTTVGAGIEWAFANNWSVFAEYNHYFFVTKPETFIGIISPVVDIKQNIDTATLGINYRFNPWRAKLNPSHSTWREPEQSGAWEINARLTDGFTDADRTGRDARRLAR
jgi:outer membrane immunogenic protein